MLTKDDLIKLIPEPWKQFIGYDEFTKPYWDRIHSVLSSGEYYPAKENIFKSLEIIDPSDVKVVIIGQDPYINEHQAIGIAFGVKNGLQIPPSLRNIYKEIIDEYKMVVDIKKFTKRGDISKLAKEGVLLMNNIFTVIPHKSLSHKNIGWEEFSKVVIKALDTHNKVVFVGFGNYVKNILLANVKASVLLTYGHPSPLNTSNPFLGCGCFKEINKALNKMNTKGVDWMGLLEND